MRVPVAELLTVLRRLDAGGALKVDHVYDY
jgi:hypothetical protein